MPLSEEDQHEYEEDAARVESVLQMFTEEVHRGFTGYDSTDNDIIHPGFSLQFPDD
jgi:hypothetical protein